MTKEFSDYGKKGQAELPFRGGAVQGLKEWLTLPCMLDGSSVGNPPTDQHSRKDQNHGTAAYELFAGTLRDKLRQLHYQKDMGGKADQIHEFLNAHNDKVLKYDQGWLLRR